MLEQQENLANLDIVDLLNSLVPTRPPERDVSSAGNYEQSQQWLRECQQNHKDCQVDSNPCLPSRVIDVSNVDVDPKLHISAVNERGQYVALSYCWGGPQASKTTIANLETYKSRLNLSSLPQTLQDAVCVTRKLGFPYLWVDSLCIIQDDENDKQKELVQMGSIYHNAFLTISAASASACAQGFLNVRPNPQFAVKLYSTTPTFQSISLQLRQSSDIIGHVALTPMLEEAEAARCDPVVYRAWTLQESLLSTRLLIYGGTQLFWRCKTNLGQIGGLLSWPFYAEFAPILALSDAAPIDSDREYSLSLAPITIKTVFGLEGYDVDPTDSPSYASGVQLPRAQSEWLRIVGIYTRRQMSIPQDVFPAIAGVAEEYHRVTDDIYCAGLWLKHLLIGLAWRRGTRSGIIRRTRIWRAPSWSWASLDGAVDYDVSQHHWSFMVPLAETKDVSLSRATSLSRYDQLVSAWVTIDCHLILVTIEPLLKSVRIDSREIRNSISQFADVFIGDRIFLPQPSGIVYATIERWGTAVLDESIESIPFHWSPPAGGGPLYALTLFGSDHWPASPTDKYPRRAERHHGLLVTQLSDGTFTRVGWFNTFARNHEEAAPWFGKAQRRIVKLV